MTRFNLLDKLSTVHERELKMKGGECMSFDYSALSGKIVEKYGTQYNFAIAMNLSERSLSLKLNNKVPWKDGEILKAKELLDIVSEDIPYYFFNVKVHEREQTT